MMLGLLLAFWSLPTMTRGHLLFSTLMTGYIAIGIWMEERSLLRKLGEDYRSYQRRTPMLIPAFPVRHSATAGQEPPSISAQGDAT